MVVELIEATSVEIENITVVTQSAISKITVLSDVSAEISTVLTAEFATGQVFLFDIFKRLENVLSAKAALIAGDLQKKLVSKCS